MENVTQQNFNNLKKIHNNMEDEILWEIFSSFNFDLDKTLDFLQDIKKEENLVEKKKDNKASLIEKKDNKFNLFNLFNKPKNHNDYHLIDNDEDDI